jgi:hypothetical protein
VDAVVVRADQDFESLTVATAGCFENLFVAIPGRIEVVVDLRKATRGYPWLPVATSGYT